MTTQNQSNGKVSMLREQFSGASHNFLTMLDGITDEALHAQPGGTANSIAAIVGHVVTAVDRITNGMLKQSAPLGVMQPTGLSEEAPSGADMYNWYDWGTRVRVDLPVTTGFAKAVFANVDAYLEPMTDSDLDAELQTQVGPQSLFWMLNNVVLSNITQHTGEISALKGLQGLKGYSV